MASAKQRPQKPHSTRSRTRSSTSAQNVAVRRYFTIPGRDPFEEVEWEIRDALIPGKDEAGLRAEGRRVPEVLVADGHEHRRAEVLPRPHGLARPRVEREADDRAHRRHGRLVGPRGRLLRRRGGGRDLRGRAEDDPRQPVRGVQQPGLVQRRLRGEAAVLGVLHPLDRGLDGVDPRLDPPRGRHLPRRLGLGRQPLEAALLEGAALEGRLRLRAGELHARRRRVGRHDQVRRQDAARGEDGRPRRRPSGHRGVHLVQVEGGGEGARPRGGRLRHVARLGRLGLDPVPEREQLGARHRRVHGGRRGGRRLEPDRPHRRHGRRDDAREEAPAGHGRRRPGSAPTRASSTTRRSTSGTRCRTRAASTRRTRARSTCRSTTRRATSRRSTS